jgi:glycine/D-amino acid oxidase-like deaminating enzyme
MTTGWNRRRVIVTGAFGAAVAAAGWNARGLFGSGGGIQLPGRSRARPVRTDAAPPAQADVVIIGGGLLGVCTAFELAKAGISVAVCEKGVVAGEASGRSQGQVASAGLAPWKLHLINLSKSLWAGMNEAVAGETGYRRTGLICPFTEEGDRQDWEQWIEQVRTLAPTARLAGAEEANRLVPAAKHWQGAFCDPTDGAAEPTLAAPAIAEAALRAGAKIVAPCAVRGFETAGGRVSHVVTEHGAIRTSTVVLAAGCWSTLFAEQAGLTLPSLNIFTTQLHVDGFTGPAFIASMPGIDFRTEMDGSYTLGATRGLIAITPAVLRHLWDFRHVILHPPWDVHPNLSGYFFEELREGRRWRLDEVSPFEKVRVLEPAINTRLRKELLSAAHASLPASRNARILETWSGALNVTPDNVPVISSVKSIPGLYLATGFSYGLTMGPAVGLLMSQLVRGTQPAIDLSPYRYERFIDGSELTLSA